MAEGQCTFKPRTGGHLIAALWVILAMLGFFPRGSVLLYMCSILLALGVLAASIGVMVGIEKERRNYFVPWFITTTCYAIFMLIAFLLYLHASQTFFAGILWSSVIAGLAFLGYCWARMSILFEQMGEEIK